MATLVPDPITAPSPSTLLVAGSLVSYRLFDVGYALDLEHAGRLLEGLATGRTRPTRGEAKALVIAQPPLILALGPTTLPGGGPWSAAELSACCFDFGVISLRSRVPVPEGTEWRDLVRMSRSLERLDLSGVFGPALSSLISRSQ